MPLGDGNLCQIAGGGDAGVGVFAVERPLPLWWWISLRKSTAGRSGITELDRFGWSANTHREQAP